MTVAEAEKALRQEHECSDFYCSELRPCHFAKRLQQRIDDLKAAVVTAVLGGMTI